MRYFLWVGTAILGSLALATMGGAGEGKGTEVVLDKLKATTPADWKMQKPASKLRLYEFTVPKAEGDTKDTEVLIFHFPGGGSVEQNIERWKKMFRPPAGKKIDDVAKIKSFEVGNAKLAYLDVHGTYVTKFPPFDPKAKEVALPDYRMLAVFFDCDNGPYFIRLTGPAKSVEQAKKGFDEWLRNFK